MADIETLLAAVAEKPPCGPDLEYDAQFIALGMAASGKPEQQMGSHVVAAEQPDWAAVRLQAEALLARTKDLRVALLLVRALVRLDNLPGLRDGLALLRGLIERYWEQVHPVPDPHDPGDLITRMNVLAQLADPTALLRDVRAALVVASGAHGRVSVRDILVAAGRAQPAQGEMVSSQAQIDSALAAAAAQDRGPIDAAADSAAAVKAIEALLAEKAGATGAPDLHPLAELLKPVAAACANAITKLSGDAAAAPRAEEDKPNEVAPAAPAPGEIRNRADAIQALETVCQFFERTEPGNPVPLLIRRAQRLVDKNFVEILQDLVPESLTQLRTIAGIKNE